MYADIAKFYKRPRLNILNHVLYGLLLERIGRVEIAGQREAALFGPPRLNHRTRKLEASFLHLGEYYRVNCPYCNDRRFRLYVNHLWCTPSPVDGEPLWHLATCYNQDCLHDHYRDFHERVWGFRNASTRAAMKTMKVAEGVVVDRPHSHAPLPGECFAVDQLDRDHPAVIYLEDRGFDVHELGSTWGVAYCKRALGIYGQAGQRLIVPIQFEGLQVGWQARYLGELDWKKAGVPKYYTLSHFKTGKVLYNYDRAREHDLVVVCEGVADVWAVGDQGVALFGKTLGQHQQELLSGWAARERGLIVLMLDPGAWGDPAKHKAFLDEFRVRMGQKVVEVALPDRRDPGQYERRALWRLIHAQVRAAGFDPGPSR
jgi:hypothetical protein